MVSAYAFYLAAFRPEEMKTGSGAGRALFFVRFGCGLRRPTQAQRFVRRHSPDCIPARGVTNIFASWWSHAARHDEVMHHTEGRSHASHGGSIDEGRAYGP